MWLGLTSPYPHAHPHPHPLTPTPTPTPTFITPTTSICSFRLHPQSILPSHLQSGIHLFSIHLPAGGLVVCHNSPSCPPTVTRNLKRSVTVLCESLSSNPTPCHALPRFQRISFYPLFTQKCATCGSYPRAFECGVKKPVRLLYSFCPVFTVDFSVEAIARMSFPDLKTSRWEVHVYGSKK